MVMNSEIELAEDEGCIIFDFGCYFPYSNPDILTFDFSLGMEKFDDYKINHRYPNKYYQTISKKYGRKVSKIGYPYIIKLNEQSNILLCLNVGIKSQYVTLIFPLVTRLTKDAPICSLSLHYNFDKNEFCFMSQENTNNGIIRHSWRNYEEKNGKKSDNDIFLNLPCRMDNDSSTLLYNDAIELSPCPLSQLLFI
jgi:hypothetical protein